MSYAKLISDAQRAIVKIKEPGSGAQTIVTLVRLSNKKWRCCNDRVLKEDAIAQELENPSTNSIVLLMDYGGPDITKPSIFDRIESHQNTEPIPEGNDAQQQQPAPIDEDVDEVEIYDDSWRL